LRKSSRVWIWQHDKRTDHYKIILNCVRKLMKNKSEKEARKGPSFKKKFVKSIGALLRSLSLLFLKTGSIHKDPNVGLDGARPSLEHVFKNNMILTNSKIGPTQTIHVTYETYFLFSVYG
jgi:hypothetical protein